MNFSTKKITTAMVRIFLQIITFNRYGRRLQKLSSARKANGEFSSKSRLNEIRISPLRGSGGGLLAGCKKFLAHSPHAIPPPDPLKGEIDSGSKLRFVNKNDISLFQLFRATSKLAGLVFFITFLFCSCQNDGKKNIKNFYYPIDEWKDGMVYEYQPVNDKSHPPEYWYFRKLETDTATYLAGQYYDHNFTVRQFFSAELVSNGVLMNEYSLMEYDSLGGMTRRPAEILAANSFPFEVKDSTGLFLFKLKWKNPTVEDAYLEMVRNRRYMGETTYNFKGKPQDCVAFKVKELVDDYNNGHLEQTYDGKEIYAKYLGLIYYKKEIGENFVLEYELKDTFSMAKLEAKFKNYLGE